MSPKLAKWLCIVAAIGSAFAIIKVLSTSKSASPEAVNRAEAAETVRASRRDRNVESKMDEPIDLTGVPGGTSAEPARGGAKAVSSNRSVERWMLIMKENRLPLISSGSLRLTEAAAALLELPPEQAQAVNLAIDRFLDRLRTEEVAHAYVSVDPNGKEQIVVRPFERAKMIEAFRNELQTAGGADVAQFLGNQATFNPTLAAGNWEMRAYIEHTPDGRDMEVFVRTLDALVVTVDGHDLPPRERLISKGSLGSDARIQHLLAAINQLPRVVETLPRPGAPRASKPAK